ncbi:MAG TPA: cysteine desulfurase NifS [Lentisphaeria bacterium]|nr:cysteine desulfurase NifS [Lentisphaerota bacterium]HPY89309.1 cysteine desulfurase NifS [Lentisphaeria bacterium]HQC53537.1 cysteine desulfurase NifS [Lentisphaeria bacterium]HQL88630.1 cysteine desulfurase NifS [Lentisphaeria bacterium]
MSEQDIIYVDSNATTLIAPEVYAAMVPYLTTWYGNPSSPHPFGNSAAEVIADARKSIGDLIGADEDEIVFTSCGTEADNTAIMSALETQKGRRRIVTTAVEHHAVFSLCHVLRKRGWPVDFLSVDKQGRLDLDEARAVINDETAIVSVMWANNEIGNIYPVVELAKIAHAHGALFHTDAVQAVGKVPINLRETKIDFLALSGHKLHAPKGVGALYVRRHTPFAPYLIGGGQEHGRRAGTENVASLAGLGKAAELARDHLEEENTTVKALRDKLERGLVAACPDPLVNGDPEHRLPNTLSVCFKYIEGEAILLRMYDAARICASSGSACTSGSLEPSHVLRAMGLDYQALHGSIRFSLSRYNTEAEIDAIIAATPPIIKELRRLSPYGR